MKIKLFLTDVDGVLTDAGMYYTESGDEFKKFNTRDGMGMKMLREAGVKVGIITTENTKIVERRAQKLKVDYLYQGAYPKVDAALDACAKAGVDLKETAYIGDDVNCLELLSVVGLAACPSDAVEKVKAIPNILEMSKKGGEGCVREFVELILEKYS
jgi:YrbI family 3-deoxy-D-manno-octulosonate 8-phosphate phosphatase